MAHGGFLKVSFVRVLEDISVTGLASQPLLQPAIWRRPGTDPAWSGRMAKAAAAIGADAGKGPRNGLGWAIWRGRVAREWALRSAFMRAFPGGCRFPSSSFVVEGAHSPARSAWAPAGSIQNESDLHCAFAISPGEMR